MYAIGRGGRILGLHVVILTKFCTVLLNIGESSLWRGYTVARLVEVLPTSRKVVSSIPDGVIVKYFIDLILPPALWLWSRLSI